MNKQGYHGAPLFRAHLIGLTTLTMNRCHHVHSSLASSPMNRMIPMDRQHAEEEVNGRASTV